MVGEHGAVDHIGESAFEDAECFHAAVAVGYASVEQLTRGGCIRAWVNAMRCRAALSCRFPVRDKRCRCLLEDQTGIGAVPLSRAKASFDRNRPTWAVSPMIFAAVSAPQPTMASSDGATVVTRSVISAVSSSISTVSSRRKCLPGAAPAGVPGWYCDTQRGELSPCQRRWRARFLPVVSTPGSSSCRCQRRREMMRVRSATRSSR